MPTALPEHRRIEATFPAVPMLMVPACVVAVSAFFDSGGLSPQAVADMLFRASEALAQAELALLRCKLE